MQFTGKRFLGSIPSTEGKKKKEYSQVSIFYRVLKMRIGLFQ